MLLPVSVCARIRVCMCSILDGFSSGNHTWLFILARDGPTKEPVRIAAKGVFLGRCEQMSTHSQQDTKDDRGKTWLQ